MSRVSRSPGLLRFSRGALGSGFPIQLSPFRGWLSGSSDHRVGLAELLRTSGLVLRSLCTLPTWAWPGLSGFGVFYVWVFSGSPSGCECCVLCFRHVDVALQDLPCSSVGGLHCPGPVNARIIAWEIDFNLWGRSGFPGLLGAPHRLTVRAVGSSISVLLLAPDAWARGCGPWFAMSSVSCPVGRSHSCCRSVSSL